MAVTAPNEYMGLGVSQVQALRLSKLSEILNTLNPMATDADTLMAEGACYQCLGATPGEVVELVLLDLIQTNVGGSGATGQIKVYTSDPNTELVVPDDTAQPAMAYSADGSGSIYGWDVGGQTWV